MLTLTRSITYICLSPLTFQTPSHSSNPKQTKMPEAMATATPVNETKGAESIEIVLNLLRHLNPSETEKNLNLIVEALPELKDPLREVVDVPSRVIVACEASNREYLSFPMAKNNESCGSCYR